MIVAVLQVGAEGGQQLDTAGGDVLRALLLQVGETHALVCFSLQPGDNVENEREAYVMTHTTHTVCVCVSYLEEGDSLGRGSSQTELQFAPHILQQED